MARLFEYRVCQVQESRVTFVNGKWQGKIPPSHDHEEALNTCPEVWIYLRRVGGEGWELASATAVTAKEATYQLLYLKREQV
ncbi:MAG: hypothetical protein HYS12_19765 [Planctomycetes bacterium]|nr:hypothetical protein [Planctomycetota bacterium]